MADDTMHLSASRYFISNNAKRLPFTWNLAVKLSDVKDSQVHCFKVASRTINCDNSIVAFYGLYGLYLPCILLYTFMNIIILIFSFLRPKKYRISKALNQRLFILVVIRNRTTLGKPFFGEISVTLMKETKAPYFHGRDCHMKTTNIVVGS